MAWMPIATPWWRVDCASNVSADGEHPHQALQIVDTDMAPGSRLGSGIQLNLKRGQARIQDLKDPSPEQSKT